MGAPVFAADGEHPLQLAQASAGGGGAGNSSGSTGNASPGGGAGTTGSGAAGASGTTAGGANDSGARGSNDNASSTRNFMAPNPGTDAGTTGGAQDRPMNRGTTSRDDGVRSSAGQRRLFGPSPAYGDHNPQELNMDRRGHAGVQPGASDTRTWLRPESDNAQAQ
jgi:hypothetical protein